MSLGTAAANGPQLCDRNHAVDVVGMVFAAAEPLARPFPIEMFRVHRGAGGVIALRHANAPILDAPKGSIRVTIDDCTLESK
jgi:hypothetical protein